MNSGGATLSPEDRAWLDRVRATSSLDDLREVTDSDSYDDAYLEAKHRWYELRDVELPPAESSGLPADTVDVDGRRFHVHGVTHSGTEAERRHVRSHVRRYLDRGADVYCEQGLRRMYFDDLAEVYESDDYDWATEVCESTEVCSRIEDEDDVSDVLTRGFDAVTEEAEEVLDRVRERLFSAVEEGETVYGERVAEALGDSLSCLLSKDTALARGDDYRAYRYSEAAAEDPGRLGELQRYYHRRFLPQPLEREWLWRHAPEVEAFTHARNERIADYVVYDSEADDVHVVVGAAHQPGVTYYLQQHASGERSASEFQPLG